MAALAACRPGSAEPAPPRVNEQTRSLVDQAERHELARRHDRARAAYVRAIEQAPDATSRAYAGREYASTLISWGEYERAEDQLELVVALAPADPSAWHDLGLLRHRRGDGPGARQALEQSVTAAPRDPRPRIALAAVLVNQRHLSEAVAVYREVLDLELPDRTRAAVERALALLAEEMAADGAPPAQ